MSKAGKAGRVRLIIFPLLLTLVGFGLGYFVGRGYHPRTDLQHWTERRETIYASYPHVQDAMRRWAAKNGMSVDRAMKGRIIEMMHFPDRDCVQFEIELGSVGGVPIYCYRTDTGTLVPRSTNELIDEHSDVE